MSTEATKVQIKHRHTGAVLFECEAPADLDSGMHMRHAMEKATKERANLSSADLSSAYLYGADLSSANLSSANLSSAYLRGAYLYGAYLSSADLSSADLYGANLSSANLSSANLSSADLYGANLSSANLSSANLSSANLSSADLYGAKLIGERPFIQIGPIGSRNDYLIAFVTDQGIKLRAGCFFGSVDEFRKKLSASHGTNSHATEYSAALEFISVHARLWTPTDSAQEAA